MRRNTIALLCLALIGASIWLLSHGRSERVAAVARAVAFPAKNAPAPDAPVLPLASPTAAAAPAAPVLPAPAQPSAAVGAARVPQASAPGAKPATPSEWERLDQPVILETALRPQPDGSVR